MPGPFITLEGAQEFIRGLKECGPAWDRMLRNLNGDISRWIAEEARGRAETAQQRKAAGAIAGRGDRYGAKIVINRRPPFAQGAFFGALQYPQFPMWVGNSWEVGGAGGPAAINPAIRENKDEIVKRFGDAFETVASRAFSSRNVTQADDFIFGNFQSRFVATSAAGAF